jgi:hypothetical protein
MDYMSEEIDIIELLKRVKEGKAPKRIEIDDKMYWRTKDTLNNPLEKLYFSYSNLYNADEYWLSDTKIFFTTKIKILDKPQNQIIEELDDKEINWLVKSSENEHIPERERTIINCMVELYNAVEEIIDNINKGE